LSLGYVVDSNPEKDEKDPKEDPVYYPADRGKDNDDESSNNDDNDDDIEKDEEDKVEEEHLAPADPSDVSTDDLETMTTVNQGMSVEEWMSVQEIEQVIAQRVANAIEVIAIYETKTNLAYKSMSQTERQEEEVAENASNKRKWGSNHNGSLSQQNKGHKVPRAHTAWPINKKAHAGSLPLCNKCKSHHNGPYTVSLGHYKSECPIVKFHKHVDMIHGRMRASKPKTTHDAIEIATKLRNKKISTLVECQTKNKKRLDNTSKNNPDQQQPNKRQNTGRAYTARHGEKKHYSGAKPLCSKCNYHHDGPCAPKCHKCNRFGHLARDCRSSTNANTTNIQKGTGAKLAKLHEHDTQDLYALLEDAQDGKTRISQRVAMDSQRVDLLMGDRITLHETVWIMEEEAYAARVAWVHSVGLSQTVYYELQTLREQVYAQEYQLQTHQTQLQLQKMGDMQAELLALRGQSRRAGQSGGDVRVLNHQDAPMDADSHV
nr:hypothetical protein [Tanacetum cinerariifolium]